MPDKFKIGLITDSRRVSKYVRQFIEWAETQDHLYISNLIIQDIHRSQLANIHNGKFLLKKPGIIHSLQRASFALITKLESIVIQKSKKYKGHFKKFDVGPAFKKTLHIKPIVSESGLVYRFSQQDVEEIRNLNLDALVHVGSGLLRGDILQAATFGVICADASDVRFFRGGPPGFWEVFTKRDCTGFTIQQLTEERDRENILFRGQFSTRFFYVLNQAFLYIRSNYYLQKVLSDIARTRSLPPFIGSIPYFNPTFGIPSLYQQLLYLFTVAKKVVYKKIDKLFFIRMRKWAVAYTYCNWNELVMWRGIRIPNPPGHFLADPFVMTVNNETCCFVEDFDKVTDKGGISAYRLNEHGAERLGLVISEPFHMSFPYIFKYQSKIYMCPETCINKDIRVYECVSFPLEWKLKEVIMSNISAADTMIFEHDGLWWMFTNIDSLESDDHCLQLSIFYADNPLSTHWQAHPKNPIFVDSSKARNAGFLTDDHSMYRISQQQGFDQYGKGAVMQKITVLNKIQYEEEFVIAIEPNFFDGIDGTHHMHSNNLYTVYDFFK